MRLLERHSFRAALALECRDGVTGRPVTDGLAARVWLALDPARGFTARRSPVSGMLGVGVLPGLALTRIGAPGVDAVWDGVTPVPVCALVTDALGRYLPVSIAVGAPAKEELVLASRPARPAPSGYATARGQVRDQTGAPCPWSVVDVDGHSTVADGRGVFVVHLPWPDALPPLGGAAAGLGDLSWDVDVAVRSEQAALTRLPGLGPEDPPEIHSIDAQGDASLRDDHGDDQPSLTRTLHFGQPLDLTLTAVPS